MMDGGRGAVGSTVRQGGSSRQAAPLTDPPTILFLVMWSPLPPTSIRAAVLHCCVWNNFTLSLQSLYLGVQHYMHKLQECRVWFCDYLSHCGMIGQQIKKNKKTRVWCVIAGPFISYAYWRLPNSITIIYSNFFCMLSNDSAYETRCPGLLLGLG